MKVVAIVQARMGSSRFPGKVMRPIGGTPMIGLLLERLSKATRLSRIAVATSEREADTPLAEYVRRIGYDVFRGHEDDVLDRYYRAAQVMGADTIVRITGDCPLIDPALVDEVVQRFVESGSDYAANILPPTYPDGLDTEVFSFACLEAAWRDARAVAHREHVTPFIRESSQFSKTNVLHHADHSDERWTVDEPEDFAVVEKVFEHFAPRRDFSWIEVLDLRRRHPEWFEANKGIARNEGLQLTPGQKLWKRAKRVIPGGNMLLSKRPEMFLPDQWPAYFSRAAGCHVWSLEGLEYVDMSLMGIGTSTLGYGHADVDRAVCETVAAGNVATLNCPEEVYLAERLVELHPWGEMVRLARSGGEANAVAIRIARAASGREQVAICGYHGWHDWYLAANLADDRSLDGHLLPGLEPRGVPGALRGSVMPFRYNRLHELEAIVRDHDIGVICMEVSRNVGPDAGFLEGVRRLATERGIVLVFDECTSGFRQTFGGVHKMYGVEPDVAVFGKALGNGYAITAVVGRRAVMEAAQQTFISSTFWTERIGPAAALKTLEVMERERSWERITETGGVINRGWQALAARHGLEIEISGMPALTAFKFPSANMLKYKTLITQEMLRKGFLAATAVYTSLAHTPEVVERYLAALDPVFGTIKECEQGRPVDELLEGPVCHAGFARLN